MRIADPRIRQVARAIGYHNFGAGPWRLHSIPDEVGPAHQVRKRDRRRSITAAVRVLDALDTVRHCGPAPGPIDGLTDDEADRFADAIREGR